MRWFRSLDPKAQFRLFCFSHAGGGLADYRRWSSKLPNGVTVDPVVLPGREQRMAETAFDRMEPLVDDLMTELFDLADETPYALVGHSMGAWIAFEACRRLRDEGSPLPQKLVVIARRAPDIPAHLPALSALPETLFLGAVQDRYGAFPAALLDHPSLLRMFIPALRADFSVLDNYSYRDARPLPVPIVTIGATRDDTVSQDDLDGWQRHTTLPLEHVTLNGGHFLPREPQSGLLEAILDRVDTDLA